MQQFRDAAGYRAGFVAVVGRPNVGKSTLMNHYVGTKVSIVSPRPQTTRHRILGVDTGDDAQVVFIDTPGLHIGQKKAINRVMNRSAISALSDAEVVLWLVEAGRFTAEDRTVASRLESVKVPVIAVINKIDQLADKRRLLPFMEQMNSQRDLHAAIPISALKGTGTDLLRDEIVPLLPESPAMFPDEMLTDRGESFRMAEIVREKLTLRLRQELPYGLTVQTERMARRDDGKLEINTIIFVERDSQKGIVVGKGGHNLKQVGSSARREIERMLGESVHLDLWVKVRDNWADSEQDLNRLGFDMGD
ncbi:MAG: GTPase Era [Pseudomonadota bacterium]